MFSNIPFVFMTAIVVKEETQSIETDIGGNLFLAKPVKTVELIATIEQVLS